MQTALLQYRSIAMKKLLFSTALGALAIAVSPVGANTHDRTATIVSQDLSGSSGRCTVEVVVPGAAHVRVEGNSAKLYELSGRSPEWRRFECTSPMPVKPGAFRMEAIDGRGRLDLVHGPRHHGGDALVYIHDSKSGEDSYTFNLVWGNGSTEHID
jgi:hypothetical protein